MEERKKRNRETMKAKKNKTDEMIITITVKQFNNAVEQYHQEKMKDVIKFLEWANIEAYDVETTADLGHDFAELLRIKTDKLLK